MKYEPNRKWEEIEDFFKWIYDGDDDSKMQIRKNHNRNLKKYLHGYQKAYYTYYDPFPKINPIFDSFLPDVDSFSS